MNIRFKNCNLSFTKTIYRFLSEFIALENSNSVLNKDRGNWTPSPFGAANLYKIAIPTGTNAVLLKNVGGSSAVVNEGKYYATGYASFNSDVSLDGTTSVESNYVGKSTLAYDSEADIITITPVQGAECIVVTVYAGQTNGNAENNVKVIFT